ncbi:MAG: hypothetical protein HFE47_07095 [Clostridia bacterium]|nr:hypothetical protein [Clostridia bacterium]
MRRIAAVLGVLLMLTGVKLYELQPADCGYAGETRVLSHSVRYDFLGDETCARNAVNNLKGKILWSESCENGKTVYYAYSKRIYDSVTIGGWRVNIVAEVVGNEVHIGVPLLEDG